MINWGATVFGRFAVICAFLFAFTACGGGGGGGFLPASGDAEYFVSMSLVDSADQPTNRVTPSERGKLQIRVTEGSASGKPVASIVVTVVSDTEIGLLDPANGTALTDASGVASMFVVAGTGKGAGNLTASIDIGGETFSDTLGFQVGESGLRLGYFEIDGTFIENQIFVEPQAVLSAGGRAQLSVVILNAAGERVNTAEEVVFNSGCIAAGQSSISPANPVMSADGQASTVYQAKGSSGETTVQTCSGTDQVTATLVGAESAAFATLSIAPPEANAVLFVSSDPNPALIVLRNTGGPGRDETAEVVFQVIDGNGLPLQGVTVDFTLSTEVGGLSVTPSSSISDGNGMITTTVSAGTVPTSVRVIATVDDGAGQDVATVSDLITVTTGLPDQDSMSLTVGDCTSEEPATLVVPNAWGIDGICRKMRVRMADKYNNPVVDGTAAVLTTEYGSIESSCFTVDGFCDVTWTSQAPRVPSSGLTYIQTIAGGPDYDCPSHNENSGPCPDDLGFTRGARSTVLVHAIGGESFTDVNGNGVMDEDERDRFTNNPEAFRDDNEDGVFTPALDECLADPLGSRRCIAGFDEEPIDFNSNDMYDFNDNPAIYNGLHCPPKGDGLWCSRDLVHVWDDVVITLSADPQWSIMLTYQGNEINATFDNRQQIAYISDVFNNPPPGGSTVKLTTDGDCEVLSEDTVEIPDLNRNGAFAVDVRTVEDDIFSPGTLTITLEPTEGTTVFRTYSCGRFVDCSFSPMPAECP